MADDVLQVTTTELLVVGDGAPEQLVVSVVAQTELLDPSPQGPPGPPGSTRLPYPVATSIGGHQAVMLQADGTVLRADATIAAHLGAVLGISITAANAPGDVLVQNSGEITFSGWSFTPGQPVFIGAAGALVQALPPGALWLQTVGWARSATRLLVALQPPITLNGAQ